MSKKVKNYTKMCEQFRVMSARCQVYKNPFTFDSLFLFNDTLTEGPVTFSSSPAPSEILPLDVLRSIVAPAKT